MMVNYGVLCAYKNVKECCAKSVTWFPPMKFETCVSNPYGEMGYDMIMMVEQKNNTIYMCIYGACICEHSF